MAIEQKNKEVVLVLKTLVQSSVDSLERCISESFFADKDFGSGPR